MNKEIEFKHVVSLGHACAVAHEMEHLGLRSHSGPFDWQGSASLEATIELIKNNFKVFFDNLTPDTLWQRQVPSCYLMKACSIYFVHDFSEYKPLAEQIPAVKEKYERRVKNFYRDIVEPTLFVYYLSDNPSDVDFINNHSDYILSVLRSFNKFNDIVYIADPKNRINHECFYVENDEGRGIAYDFTKKSEEILNFFNTIPCPSSEREKNISFFKKDKRWGQKIRKKIRRIYYKLTRSVYHHYLYDFD